MASVPGRLRHLRSRGRLCIISEQDWGGTGNSYELGKEGKLEMMMRVGLHYQFSIPYMRSWV